MILKMGLLPLEFTDALQDSPYFRLVIECVMRVIDNNIIVAGTVYIVMRRSWRGRALISRS